MRSARMEALRWVLTRQNKEDKELPQKTVESCKAYYTDIMNKKDNKYKIEQEEVKISNFKSIKLSYDLSVGSATSHLWQYFIK